MHAASRRQVQAKPASVARRPKSAYAAPPRPMPKSATARINPNVKIVPPRSGPSIRYQTSSMRKNANPLTSTAPRANHSGAAGGSGTAATACGGSDAGPRAIERAVMATSRFTSAAIHSDALVPKTSSMKKLASRHPLTAPSVFTP